MVRGRAQGAPDQRRAGAAGEARPPASGSAPRIYDVAGSKPGPPLLNYVRRGRGEPLVLIHPLGGELVVWEPVLARLARDRDVIAMDMPGFGGSPALSNGTVPTPRALA